MNPFTFLLSIYILLTVGECQLNLFRTKILKFEESRSCPKAEKNAIRFVNYRNEPTSSNVFVINTDVIVSRNVTGSLRLQLNLKRCSLDLSSCSIYEPITTKNVCEKIAQKNQLWSPLAARVQPPMHCPIREGTYRIVDGYFDMTVVSRLPIDGFRWLSYHKVYEEHMVGKVTKLRQVFCFYTDVAITMGKRVAVTGGGSPRPRKRSGGAKRNKTEALLPKGTSGEIV